VIDGEPVLRAAWNYLLSDRGYEVVVAASGEDGIEQSQGILPDLVLVDVDALWPVNQGLATIEIIRREMPDAQILVLSSWLNRRKALEAGANVCIPKPIDYSTVLKFADLMAARSGARFHNQVIESIHEEQLV
jgi:DNA-binding response OmpR family regulator